MIKEASVRKICNLKSYHKVTIDKIVLTDADVPNAFNSFFVQVAEIIKEPIVPSGHARLETFCRNRIPQEMDFNIPLLDVNKLQHFLKSIDTTKAPGTDNIGPRLLKLAAAETADSVTFICNCSINRSLFPEKWKDAKVSPLHKIEKHCCTSLVESSRKKHVQISFVS